jgi:hypothetical protein
MGVSMAQPRNTKKSLAVQRIKEIHEEVKANTPTQISNGDFSYLTGKLTEFPVSVKNPTPTSFYPVLASLAHANQLDLQYRSFAKTTDLFSIGVISDEFLGKIAEICSSWDFGCYIFHQGKMATHHWPVEYKDLDILKLLGYTPVRPVLLLGFFR